MDLNKKTTEELVKILEEKKEAQKNFRFGLSGSKVRNVKEGRALKKDTARILTELNKKNK